MRSHAYEALLNRRNPDQLFVKEAFSRIAEEQPIRYLTGAMAEVDATYTQSSFVEGDRVWNQIQKGLARNFRSAEMRCQGSTTKNTHIKGHSDLDLLILESRFYTVQNPQIPPTPYAGNPLQDLLEIRAICCDTLTTAFPAATVDSTGAKSIKLSGGSLRRVVDIVPAAWWNTNFYVNHGMEFFRGVEILDAHVPCRHTDTPFYHAKLLDLRNAETLDNLKKLVRLLKTLRADSEGDVTMSSFDIESIVYAMDPSELRFADDQEIQTATKCYQWLCAVEENETTRTSLSVPDGSRKIFSAGKATIAQLSAMRKELGLLLAEIGKILQRSFRKLADARIKLN